MKRLFLISGKAESGKDTVAKALNEHFNNFSYQMHLADSVKQVAKEDFGWNGVKDEKGRGLLQLIGDGGRAYNPQIWVDKFLLKLGEFVNSPYERNFFVPDVRYLNEVERLSEWAQKNGVQVIKIRVERPFHKNALTKEQRLNNSETELDNYPSWDFVISNTGDLEDLKKLVKGIAVTIGGDYEPKH